MHSQRQKQLVDLPTKAKYTGKAFPWGGQGNGNGLSVRDSGVVLMSKQKELVVFD